VISGIVLAAGASLRAGFPKVLAQAGDTTFVERAAQTLLAAGAAELVVVVAPPHDRAVRAALAAVPACFVENPAPERGMLSSLQLALSALGSQAEAALVSLVDHPGVSPATVAALIERWQASGADVVRPVFGGRGGHPLLIARRAFASIGAHPSTATTREALSGLARVDLEVGDQAVLEDIDRPPAPR
jgi:molybdenum cofactor cytidylyltransferase